MPLIFAATAFAVQPPLAVVESALPAHLMAALKAELKAELRAELITLGPPGASPPSPAPPPWRTVLNAVDDFGCDPTRRTDSSPAMQRAVDAAGKLPNGGSVYLPAGSYNMEGIHVPSNVDIFGDSRGRTGLLIMSTNATLFTVANSFNVRIRDLMLVGPQYLLPTAGALIHAFNAQGSQFTNLQLSTFWIGLAVNASTNCEISFIKAGACYGPAMLQLTGANMNGGGCYGVKNQFDSVQGYGAWGSPSVEAGYGPWQPATPYKEGDVRSSNGGYFICSKSGTSAANGTACNGPSASPFANRDNTPHQIVDGSARWQYLCMIGAVTIDINNANSNQIFANDLSSVGHAAIRITNAQSNIITQNYPAATCAHGIEIGANTADNTIALNHFQNLPGHGVYESSAADSVRNVYADNKFNNIGLSAAYLQQEGATFRGNTITSANLNVLPDGDGAAVEVAADTSFVSRVVDNKVFGSGNQTVVGVRFAPGRSDRCKVLGNNIGHLPVALEMHGVSGDHNDVRDNN